MSETLKTTLGRSLFYDALCGAYCITDIRHKLEIKLAACVATGGTNGCPILPHRVKNEAIRSLVFGGMNWMDWNLRDLLKCTGRLESAAALVLLATLEKPIWGQDDCYLLETIERLEYYQNLAWKGGLTL